MTSRSRPPDIGRRDSVHKGYVFPAGKTERWMYEEKHQGDVRGTGGRREKYGS